MSPERLVPHILKAMARHQLNERSITLQTLVEELGVRRADLRSTITALDQEGYLDALRMRLTMSGFALGAGLQESELPPLRQKAKKATLHAA